jgi:hypothetical protein
MPHYLRARFYRALALLSLSLGRTIGAGSAALYNLSIACSKREAAIYRREYERLTHQEARR